jgi:hypothetical protein
LLERDYELTWSRTHEGYGVAIVDKTESEKWMVRMNFDEEGF